MNGRLLAYGISGGALGWVCWVVLEHEVWAVDWPEPRWGAILLLTLFMPLNWGLEVAKWLRLNPALSMQSAFREVMIGAAWALLTPNRIGDLAGRVAAAPSERREQASRAFVTSSGAQLLVTVLAGAGALGIGVHWIYGVGSVLAIAAYLRWSPHLPASIRLTLRLTEQGAQPSTLVTRTEVLLLSMVRYAVFAGQMWLSFWAFGAEVKAHQVPLIFLGNALIPSAALGELGIREAMSLAVISPAAGAVGGVVVAAFVVWLINLVVPAAVGAIWQFRKT